MPRSTGHGCVKGELSWDRASASTSGSSACRCKAGGRALCGVGSAGVMGGRAQRAAYPNVAILREAHARKTHLQQSGPRCAEHAGGMRSCDSRDDFCYDAITPYLLLAWAAHRCQAVASSRQRPVSDAALAHAPQRGLQLT